MTTYHSNAIPTPNRLVRRRRYSGQAHLVLQDCHVLLDELPDFIWRTLDGARTVEQIADALSANYGCTAQAAFAATCEVLTMFAKESLVAVEPQSGSVVYTTDEDERRAATHYQHAGPHIAWGRAVLDKLVGLGLRGAETIIDAGCGPGNLTADLLDRLPGVRVIAVDSSPNVLELARETLGRHAGRVTFVCADLQEWHDDMVADIVFSVGTFHSVQDHAKLFANLYRSLRAGGQLLAQCAGGPNAARLRSRTEAHIRSEPLAPFLANWLDRWKFPGVEETRGHLASVGFLRVEASLEPTPTIFGNAAEFREHLAAISLLPVLSRIPDEALRKRLVDHVTGLAGTDDPPFSIDYCRLNLQGRRP